MTIKHSNSYLQGYANLSKYGTHDYDVFSIMPLSVEIFTLVNVLFSAWINFNPINDVSPLTNCVVFALFIILHVFNLLTSQQSYNGNSTGI